VSFKTHRIRCSGLSTRSSARRAAARLHNLKGIMHYPVSRPNRLTIAAQHLVRRTAIVITVVLGALLVPGSGSSVRTG
jgi:hypothetical protein